MELFAISDIWTHCISKYCDVWTMLNLYKTNKNMYDLFKKKTLYLFQIEKNLLHKSLRYCLHWGFFNDYKTRDNRTFAKLRAIDDNYRDNKNENVKNGIIKDEHEILNYRYYKITFEYLGKSRCILLQHRTVGWNWTKWVQTVISIYGYDDKGIYKTKSYVNKFHIIKKINVKVTDKCVIIDGLHIDYVDGDY